MCRVGCWGVGWFCAECDVGELVGWLCAECDVGELVGWLRTECGVGELAGWLCAECVVGELILRCIYFVCLFASFFAVTDCM